MRPVRLDGKPDGSFESAILCTDRAAGSGRSGPLPLPEGDGGGGRSGSLPLPAEDWGGGRLPEEDCWLALGGMVL
jgi:hypothetical protein